MLLVAAALLGVGRSLAYVPWPVIEGFTVGIAVIIFLQQVPVALGVPRPDAENVAWSPPEAVRDAVDHGSSPALGVTVLVVAAMVVAPRLHRALPASLLAVVLATLVTAAADLDVAQIGALPASLPAPTLPSVRRGQLAHRRRHRRRRARRAREPAVGKVADGMSDGARHDPDRELFGQGLANLASPLFGGMPATGAIARTAVNVRAGARTRLAAVVHALALVAVVYLAGPLVAEHPPGRPRRGAHGHRGPHGRRRTTCRPCSAPPAPTPRSWCSPPAATVLFDLIVAVEIGLAVAAVLALRDGRDDLGTAEPRHRLPGDGVTTTRRRRCSPSTSSPTGSTAPCSSAPRSGSSPSSPPCPTSGW